MTFDWRDVWMTFFVAMVAGGETCQTEICGVMKESCDSDVIEGLGSVLGDPPF